MGLLPEINENATVDRVRHFLQDEDKFPRLERLSGAWCELKSPQMDITGVRGSSAGNAIEHRFIKHAYYYSAYLAVKEAIAHMRPDSRLIIQQKYLNAVPSWQVANTLGVASTQFGKRDRRACFEFADLLEGSAYRYGITEEFGLDLHVYRNGKPAIDRQLAGEKPAKDRRMTGRYQPYIGIVEDLEKEN